MYNTTLIVNYSNNVAWLLATGVPISSNKVNPRRTKL